MADRAHRLAVAEDLLSLHPEGAYEIVDGEVVEKAAPSGEHGEAHQGVSTPIGWYFHRRPGGRDRPGGWWILPEVDIELERHQVVRPDLSGWRRARVPTCPSGFPLRERPDWVCEILSPSTAGRDLGWKRDLLHRHEVAHYWLVDRVNGVLTVLRWSAEGYVVAATAGPTGKARLEPFDAVEIDLGPIFGRDEEPEAPPAE